MRFCVVYFGCFLMAGVCASAAEPGAGPEVVPAKSPALETLIGDLSSDRFKVREDASAKLWAMGDAALEALKKTSAGDDPEAAFRANELIRNIEHHITPETDPAVVTLVERYMKANRETKPEILGEIRKRRGWYQILKLYEAETDLAVRQELDPEVHAIAIIAAREKLIEGKPEEARKFLELAPNDAQSLLSLAAFHRASGTLNAELEQAKKPGASAEWRAALYRAAGNIGQARMAADEAKDEPLAAALALFEGDPLPWFALNAAGDDNSEIRTIYLNFVQSQWKEKPKSISALEPLVKMLGSRDDDQKISASNTLFLLGEPSLAEPLYVKNSETDAVSYFESMERISEAFKVLGLDPQKKDFTAWAAKRFERNAKEEDDGEKSIDELAQMAALVDQLGLQDELQAAYEAPLLKMADANPEGFTSFMNRLFSSAGGSRHFSSTLARNIGAKWAGNDAGRWHSLMSMAFDDDETASEWWEWTKVLKPAASLAERFDAVLALMEFTPDPKRENRRWLDLAWTAIEKAPEAQQTALLKRIGAIASPVKGRGGDLATYMKVWDKLPPAERGEPGKLLATMGMAVAGRWAEAAGIFEDMLKDDETAGQTTSQAYFHAYAASCLRRAGREKDAQMHDQWVDKLALGDWAAALQNSQGYAYGGDRERSEMWLARCVIEAPPEMERYVKLLEVYSEQLMDQGKWKECGAVSEAIALDMVEGDSQAGAPPDMLKIRLKADLGHALSLVASDRARAVKMLDRCHAFYPSGGLLADEFFPQTRKAGLLKEHEQWFEQSWKIFADLAVIYPKADQLRNGAGWLGGRAGRRLDEAEKLQSEAIALNPDQAAYLDTMAEIQFAKRDRKAALKWSAESVNFSPGVEDIRRQYERFTKDPLPQY